MNISRNQVKTCCGGTSLLIKTNKTLDKGFISFMSNLGFVEAEHFTKVGIIYVESDDLILQGPMFNARLTVTCKINKDRCLQRLDEIEKELLKY